MICIFFIDGSGFKQTIKPNSQLSMYEPYDIKHFMVLKNKDHRITMYPHGKIMKKMEDFILS